MAHLYLHANTDRPGQSAPKVEAHELENGGDRWVVLGIEAEDVRVAFHLSGVGALEDLARAINAEAGRLAGITSPLCECGRGPILQGNMTPDACAECAGVGQ